MKPLTRLANASTVDSPLVSTRMLDTISKLESAGSMTESGTDEPPKPKCLDVVSWRLPTKEELRVFMDRVLDKAKERDTEGHSKPSGLVVRHHLSPVDVYCYLKGRFGEPNGFQNFLRRDTSDNLIHWDFTLRAVMKIFASGECREKFILLCRPN